MTESGLTHLLFPTFPTYYFFRGRKSIYKLLFSPSIHSLTFLSHRKIVVYCFLVSEQSFSSCNSDECISPSQRCDRVHDCSDLSDEIHCGKFFNCVQEYQIHVARCSHLFFQKNLRAFLMLSQTFLFPNFWHWKRTKLCHIYICVDLWLIRWKVSFVNVEKITRPRNFFPLTMFSYPFESNKIIQKWGLMVDQIL